MMICCSYLGLTFEQGRFLSDFGAEIARVAYLDGYSSELKKSRREVLERQLMEGGAE
jgi:hypothetical protein